VREDERGSGRWDETKRWWRKTTGGEGRMRMLPEDGFWKFRLCWRISKDERVVERRKKSSGGTGEEPSSRASLAFERDRRESDDEREVSLSAGGHRSCLD
jgi:hypothetical protein